MVAAIFMEIDLLLNWLLLLAMGVFVFDVWERRGWENRDDD